MHEKTVYIIDDEEDLLFLVETRLARAGFDPRCFQDLDSLRQSLEQRGESDSRCFVLSDFRLEASDGYEVFAAVKDLKGICGFALQTGFSPNELEELSEVPFPTAVFEKPVDLERVIDFISKCFDSSIQEKEQAS